MITRRTLLAAAMAPNTRRHIVAKVEAAETAPPAGERISFGWRGVALRGEVRLNFPKPGRRLRITNALDSREPRVVDVLAADGARLEAFDLRYAYAGQVFEVTLPSAQRQVSLRQSVGQGMTWILSSGAPEALLPHLLIEEGGPSPK